MLLWHGFPRVRPAHYPHSFFSPIGTVDKTMEAFIEQVTLLLLAYPATSVSITYLNQTKKQKLATKVTKPATNKVTFKVFEPQLGKIIKFSTIKSRELTRVLAFLGPRGVNYGVGIQLLGMARVMANVAQEEKEPTPEKEATPAKKEETPVPETKLKKNKKKKNKKR